MRINIYHTNDIHSNYAFLKKVHAYLKENKGINDLYFDSGDFMDLKDLIVDADRGSSAAKLLMSLKPDGLTIGNGEVDLGYDGLSNVTKNNYPYICSNITDNDSKAIEGIRDYLIIERNNKKLLILGIAPYYKPDMTSLNYNDFSMMSNLMFHSPIDKVKKILKEVEHDYVILLSHSGFKQEEILIKIFEDIDLCLGGHSHTVYNAPGYSQSGKGEYLGKIVLDIGEKIEEIENIQIDLEEYEDVEFDELLKEKEIKADEILSKEMNICEELELDHLKESRLINFICDALYKKFDADLAVMHAGIAEESLYRPVSRKSLLKNFPSKLNPTVFKVKGKDLLEAILLSFDEEYIKQSGKAAGFRGKILGTLGYSHNVRIHKDKKEVYIDNLPLDLNKEYRIAADDYLQRGSGYPSLAVPNEEAEFDVWFIRDLVENYLEDREVFDNSKIKRIY